MLPDPPLQAAPVVAEVVAAVGKSATNHTIAAGNTSRKDSARERQVCRREAFAVYGGATTARAEVAGEGGIGHRQAAGIGEGAAPTIASARGYVPHECAVRHGRGGNQRCTSETAPASYALLFENVLPEIVAELLSST